MRPLVILSSLVSPYGSLLPPPDERGAACDEQEIEYSGVTLLWKSKKQPTTEESLKHLVSLR
jgi:hypothetical protein